MPTIPAAQGQYSPTIRESPKTGRLAAMPPPPPSFAAHPQKEMLEAETAIEALPPPAVVSRHGSVFQRFIGRTLNGYRIDKMLGEGAMGAVFQAEQMKLKRTVAIKVLPPAMSSDRELIERFEREAQSLAKLEHPSIVPVYDMFEADGLFFITMGYCGGGSVKELIEEEGPLEEQTAAEIVYQTALGLWAAAEKGIVHRDIKPDNLLLNEEGRIKIADFGLVKAATEGNMDFTMPGTVMGTPAYMSPEQWRDSRKTDHRSDLYSLGCTLYALLCSEQVFFGPSSANLMEQHLMQQPPNISVKRQGLSAQMTMVVTKLLQKDPTMRFQTGQELAEAVAPLMGDNFDPTGSGMAIQRPKLPTIPAGLQPGMPIRRTPRRAHRTMPGIPIPVGAGPKFSPMVILIVLSLVLVALLGFWFTSGNSGKPTEPPQGNQGNSGSPAPTSFILDLPEIPQTSLDAAPQNVRLSRNNAGYAAGRWKLFAMTWKKPAPAAIEEAKAAMHMGDSNLNLENYPEAVEAYELAERLYNAAVSECTKMLDAQKDRD